MVANSSCDIKINIKIVQNCCRNLAVRGLNTASFCSQSRGINGNFVNSK